VLLPFEPPGTASTGATGDGRPDAGVETG